MLDISRWKAAAILFTVLFVSAMAIPNFLPETALVSWPLRKINLGIYGQDGGSQIVMAVDRDAIRREALNDLRGEVRKLLRDARIPLPILEIRGNGLDVRVRDKSDFARTLSRLKELSWPTQRDTIVAAMQQFRSPTIVSGANQSLTANHRVSLPPPEVIVEAKDGLIAISIVEAAFEQRVRRGLAASINTVIRPRTDALGGHVSIVAWASDRVMVEFPGPHDIRRLSY
jgi:preprotein translocase subunit SecD